MGRSSAFLGQFIQEISEGQKLDPHLLKRRTQALHQPFNLLSIELEGVDIAHHVPETQVLIHVLGSLY